MASVPARIQCVLCLCLCCSYWRCCYLPQLQKFCYKGTNSLSQSRSLTDFIHSCGTMCLFIHQLVPSLLHLILSYLIWICFCWPSNRVYRCVCMCVYVDVSLWVSLNEVKCIHGFAEFELAISDGEESSKFQTHQAPFMAPSHLISSQEDRDTQRTDPQRTERTERRGTLGDVGICTGDGGAPLQRHVVSKLFR